MTEEKQASIAVPDTGPIQEIPVRETRTVDGAEPEFAYSIASNRFGHFCIPDTLDEDPVAQAVVNGGVIDEAVQHLICRKLGNGDVISGSTGFGGFLPALHGALAPSAQIHCFEPDPAAFSATSMTCRLNGLENLHMHQIIAGKRERDLPAWRLSSDAEQTGDPHTTFVRMKKLDALVPQGRYVSVIHLNSYNMEMPAILGAKRIIQDSAPMIVLKAVKLRTQRFFLSCLQAHFPSLQYQNAGVLDDNSIFVALNRA